MAVELKAQAKTEKALRLFKHALALAPRHPEILTKYGEFLEQNQSDVITADLMYFQVGYGAMQSLLTQLKRGFSSNFRHLRRIQVIAGHLPIGSVRPKSLNRWIENDWIYWTRSVTHCRRYMNRMPPCDASRRKHIFNISIIPLASKATPWRWLRRVRCWKHGWLWMGNRSTSTMKSSVWMQL